MNLCADIQIANEGDDNPDPDSIRAWLEAAIAERVDSNEDQIEVCVRIVDEEESQTLNKHYRQKDTPTNVLSFPTDWPKDIPVHHLGDIVICNTIVKREAKAQGKEIRAHWAHMVIHGALHLLGYDHIEDDEASTMETLETKILDHLLFPPPYQQHSR